MVSPRVFFNDTELDLRPIEAKDEALLVALYAETRPDLDVLVGLSAQQKKAMLRQQFEFQKIDYQQKFPEADFDIVLLNGQPVGRIYVERNADSILLIEMTVLIELRGRRIGSLLLERLRSEAIMTQKPVRLQVARFNPATKLYLRHGYQIVDDSGVFLQMEKSPN